MKVLCLLGIREAWAMVTQALAELNPASLELLLVYVVNEEHREGWMGMLGGLGRRPAPRDERAEAMDAAEDQAGAMSLGRAHQAAVDGGLAPERITQRLVRGRPEHVIVELAERERCGLIVLRANDEVHVQVPRGPASIGHVARFIIDHAPCDVLVLRSQPI